MSATSVILASIEAQTEPEPRGTTLLALVQAIGETTDDEREVIDTVLHLLRSGRVRLTGNFRDAPLYDLCDFE